jgi:hypothetical protein
VVSVFSDRTRSDTSPLSGESMYAFLDPVAGPVWNRIRKFIEDWLNGYCLTDQAEIVGRLHSKGTSTSWPHIGSCCFIMG